MELQDLRERYLSVHGEYTRLFIECRDYDLLLKDLRETLFGLRVASQVFDEYDVNPIAHSCANLSQVRVMTSHVHLGSREAFSTVPVAPSPLIITNSKRPIYWTSTPLPINCWTRSGSSGHPLSSSRVAITITANITMLNITSITIE